MEMAKDPPDSASDSDSDSDNLAAPCKRQHSTILVWATLRGVRRMLYGLSRYMVTWSYTRAKRLGLERADHIHSFVNHKRNHSILNPARTTVQATAAAATNDGLRTWEDQESTNLDMTT